MKHIPPIYNEVGLYDQQLPAYFFEKDEKLVTDEEILKDWMLAEFGQPEHQLNILEIGAGTGRMTELLLPYAKSIVCTDKYAPMLETLRDKFPEVEIVVSNTSDLKENIPADQQFDLVGAFWTLSYPVGEFLETIDGDTIVPREDLEQGAREAIEMVAGLTDYIAPTGRFVAQFFDSDSAEQEVVSRLWHQLAPDPGGRRSFTRDLTVEGLSKGAEAHDRDLHVTRYLGVTGFKNSADMSEWYRSCHCKGIEAINGTDEFTKEMDQLADKYTQADGSVSLPVGMYEFLIK